MADNVNDSLKDLGKLIEDADKKVKQLDSDYKQGVNGAIVLLDSVKSKIAEVNNVGIKKIINAKDIEEEAKKIPTVFSHVIDDINKKAQRSGDEFSKKLTNADSVRSEAQRAFASIKEEYEKATKGMTPMGAVALANRGGVDTSILSSAARKRYEKQIQSEAARLQLGPSQITPELIRRQEVAQQNLNKALQQFAELQNQANAAQNAFAAKSMAVQALADKYANIDKQIENLRQKFAELYVKKDAGLIDDKKFTTQSNAIINKYNELVAKRDEFEKGTNIATQSYERERKRIEEENRLAAIRRENANSRQRDEVNAERMIAQARAERARKEAQADASMKKSVSQQVTNYKQLSALLKQYNSLKQVKGRTQEENAALEQTRAKIKEIIAAMRELDSKQSGSLGKARDITAYDRILEKDKEITRERQKQNRLTNQQKSSLESMLPTLRRLAAAFGVAFSVQGLVQFGKKLVETRGEFELQQVALRSILQNKQLADEIWDKTMQAALQSPFTAMQLTKYTKQLAAYRIETDKLFDTTKRLADVSAGLGVDMQRLILAYGQVKAANYLRASEIRQFTEAGVNILGELSAYLTEVNGQAVTTAQVMDMVQKRMIRFEDVEEIFKRLTNEGGVFYNMQYIQSQTVKGQINKLHDAYDQMLNSIGKSNEGVLKGTVSLMLNIVQNWREWKTILDSIAFPAITVALIRFGKGLFAANAATIATDKSFKFLTRSGAKLNVQLKALGATLKAHPLFLIASIVFTAGAALINHAKAVNAVNKEYDELNGRLLETQHKMSSYEDKIKQNNDTIKDSSKSQKEHNDAQKDNARMLGELKRDYPDVANGMSIANNGIISMTNSMKEYNAQLRLQIQLNERAKASFFNQSLKKDAQQFDESLNEQQTKLAKYINQADRATERLKNLVASGKTGGLSEQTLNMAIDKLQKISAATSVSEYEKAIRDFNSTIVRTSTGSYYLQRLLKNEASGFLGLKKGEFDFTTIAGGRNLQSNREEIKDEIKDDYIYFGRYLREIALLSENWNGQFALSTEEFISKNKDLLQNMLYTVKKDGTKEIGELGFALSEAFMDAASVSMTEQGQQEIIDELINQFKEKYGLDVAFGVRTKSSERLPDEGAEDKVLNLWRNRIKLIEEMNKKYKDLSKSVYGYAKSEQKVRGDYGLAWLAAGMPFEMNEIDFTTDEGVAEALAKFRKLIPQKLFAELEKEISGRKATIELNAQVRIREDFGRQMEEAFGNYELTLDLQKLNLPSDVLSDLFDLETVDLSDLRRKVVEFYNERLAVEADPTDLIKQVEGYYKKIDDMERKQQRDRIKDYAKYLEYELSERAKIEMEYTRKSADVAANQAFTSEQKEQIQKRLKEERDKAIAKQEWEDFKSSETYIQMMEDLEHQGTNALIAMRTELERIRENAENLSPRALKEVVNALEKIDEITIRRGMPISNIRNAAAGVRSARVEALESGLSWGQVSSRKAAKQTQADIKAQLLPMEQQFNILQSQLGAEKEIARLEQKRYENGLKLGEVFGETFMTGDNEYLNEKIAENLGYIELTQENINSLIEKRKTAEGKEEQEITSQIATENTYLQQLYAENELLQKQLDYNIAIAKEALNRAATPEERASLQARINELEEELKKLREQDAAVGNLTKKYGILGDSVQDAVQKLAGWSQQAVDVFNSFKTMMTSLGVDTDTDAWDDWSTAFETIGTAASTAASMATKIASGDYIGAALDAVKGIMDIVTQWAGNNDRELERQIQKQQERIDALRDAYARLEKQIEKTWSSVSYMQTYEQQVQNIREQIDAMEAQMRAEEAKKNTDDNAVRQHQRDIQDAYDLLDELEQKSIEVFGGIGEEGYRSAAEGFVEAWKSAFLETGDGLQGLQDHFDEFLQEWFVKQATMRIAGGMLEPVFRQIDAAVDKYGDGGTSAMLSEIERVRDMAAAIFPDLSLALEDLAGMFGVGGEGSLSGLAAGIQGMTEEQANILEAYWNSVRMYTASIDQNVAMIASALGVGGNSPSTNPQLQQLQLIAASVQATHQLLQSVTRSGHSLGGYGIKVFND